ncbi:Glycosyl transferase family 2 [Roseivivax lentus]|uniref:Glycosyl transferase family 2 n=1 Tax=Roseivivax lentus TaxID=633194 RepID=A0A1N7Q585_9RHOB|nr:glycosyltransferase [Roseivivax lentus]SIT18032.1 Glycosyl transferase family 2 [Roseivivax lentus]
MHPAITIVLATRNGAAHLPAQLRSIAAQRGVAWRLLASDDGSRDDTRAILAAFAAAHPGRVRLCSGPQAGFAANFLSAAARAVAEGPGRALAFCDQDDVWLPEKLARALAQCEAGGRHAAVGVACRAVPTGPDLRPSGGAAAPGPADFAGLLFGQAPGGNRLVLSAEAAARLAATVPAALQAGVPFHDWWAALVLTGIGGRLIHDPAPGLLYRQHGAAALGHRGAAAGLVRRARLVLSGEYARMVAANLDALAAQPCALSPAARAAMARLRAGQGESWRRHLLRGAHAATLRPKPSRAISA